MPGKRSPDVIQVNLRLTKDLRKRLVAAAKGGSLNAEMVARLEASFRREKADAILDEAQAALKEAQALHDDVERLLARQRPQVIKVLVPQSQPAPKGKRK